MGVSLPLSLPSLDSWVLSTSSTGGKVALLLLAVLLYLLYRGWFFPTYRLSIRNIPGPRNDSVFSGNFKYIFKADAGVPHKEWADKYGSTFVYSGFLGQKRLYVTDPKALLYILVHKAYEYPKPMALRRALARILGEGVLFVEGDQHRHQRRLLSAPFTQASVNSYIPIFQEQALKLVAKLEASVETSKEEDKKGDYTVLNVYPWLSRVTLDIIGLAGFDYEFHAMDSEDNELANVFQNMLKPRKISLGMIIGQYLMQYFPFLAAIPTKGTKRINETTRVMQREGKKMLEQRRQRAIDGELEGKKDLLSLLVKANMQATNPKDKLGDDELMGQLSTFSLAGHETSAAAINWILYYLCLHTNVQAKLRKEVLEIKADLSSRGDTALSPDDLSRMPYLDAVVRETLRYAPPVFMTNREPSAEDFIPLSEPIKGKNGEMITSLHVKKGQQIIIGIYTLNRSKAIYGDDADDYRPERWLEEDDKMDKNAESAMKFTTWSPLMTFLAGPRGCIGYKFSLLEVKILVFELIASFEFLERDEGGTPICRKSNVVTRPVVVGEEEAGGQLPVRMRKVQRP